MTESLPIPSARREQVTSSLAYNEEGPLPSLPNFDNIYRSVGPKSTHGNRASSVFSSDDTEPYDLHMNNATRVRRLSTLTTTSIGRPRYLVTRPKVKSRDSRDADTFVRDVGTQELSSFLWTNKPSPLNWMSVPEEKQTAVKTPWYRRGKSSKSGKPVLQLPDCAVATKTPDGHWHIAIHIPTSKDFEAENMQSGVEETKGFDTMSIISKRFSRRLSAATITNKMKHRRRSYSINTIKTLHDTQPLKKLIENTVQLPSNTIQNSVASISPPVVSAYRQSLITDFVQQKPTTIVESMNMESMHTVGSDSGTQPFPDFVQSKGPQDIPAHSRSAASTSSAASTVIPFGSPSFGISAQSLAAEKAKVVALHTLEQAQRDEIEAQAVVSKAEQDAKETIPALEASINMVRNILQEAKVVAAEAMENADVEAAITAAKQAAEAQAAIRTADRQISASKLQLEKLLSVANARLAEVRMTAQTATEELRLIALAEMKANEERLHAEKTESSEVRGMEARQRKVNENNQTMMQTLSAVVEMGKGFEEMTKCLAAENMSRSDSGIWLGLQSKS